MLPDQESVGKQSHSIISTRAGLSRRDTAPRHRTRSTPSFISWACPVDLSNRDWKSAPPCSQALLMADFILSARTMNFDGLSSLWLRNVTTYVLATAGAKNSEKPRTGQEGRAFGCPASKVSFRFIYLPTGFHARFPSQSLRGVNRLSPTVKTSTVQRIIPL